ncbi:MAG: hypothetical protein HC895_03425 [Leptolyngbyaceae cyanobacterium SM1_3_5]|nr:hypothetical protein [Leptolyngbyaceae cyanobacterium SM1_3_5]
MENIDNFKLRFDVPSQDSLFAEVNFLPTSLLHSQAQSLQSAVDTQLSNHHGTLRNSIAKLKQLLLDKYPLKDHQSALNSAIGDLIHDFDEYFEIITVYRSGLFALKVKEAISKLGLGYRMDELESNELTDIQKAVIKQNAQEHIFPGASQALLALLKNSLIYKCALTTFRKSLMQSPKEPLLILMN